MTSVKMPRLLNADWSEKARLHPAALPITVQTFGVSTAQMTLSEADPDVAMHEWMELYNINGSLGLFRVTNIAPVIRKNRVLTLRHALDTFADSVWKRPDGTKLDYTGTVSAYLAAIMAQQSTVYWQLGTCEDTASFKKSGIYYTRLSELLSDLEQKRKDFYFTCDFTTTPWTLNFLRMPTNDGVEFRLSRNIEGCQIAYNDEQMCNRLYMTWSLNEETGAKTIRTYNNLADQAARGYVIEKTVDVREADVTDPDEWAANYLAERSAPSARISVDGVVLYDLTGVEWDETRRGKMARIALPDYHVTISERLLSVKYADAINLPRKITAELSNNLDTLSSALVQIQKTAESGASGASDASDAASVESHRARASESGLSSGINSLVEKTGVNSLGQQETLYTRISQNEAAITVEAGRATQAEGVLTTSVAAVKITADSVSAEVTAARGTESTLSARLNVTAQEISSIVSKTGVDSLGQSETLYSKISQTAIDISTEVTNRGNADDALSSRISQNANSIALVVENGSIKSASIVAAINGAGSTVKISADHIVLDGAAVATSLASHDVMVNTLTAANLTLGSTGYTGHLIGFTGFTRYATFLGTADLSLHHSHSISFNESGGTITATIGGESDSSTESDSFSIAATSAYQAGVAAEWNAAANAITWPAAGTGNAIGITYPVAGTRGTTSTKAYLLSQGSWSSNKMYVYLRADTAQGSAVARTEVDASSIYTAGYNASESEISVNGYYTNSGWSNNQNTYYCYARAKSSGNYTRVYDITVNAQSIYNSGYSAGQSNADLSSYSLHVSKSQGSVYLYLNNGSGTTVKSRTASISISSFSKSSNSSTLYNITVCIDGDTYFTFSKTLS